MDEPGQRRVSRPFPKPQPWRIAVKVINHLDDKVMRVFISENVRPCGILPYI